MAGFATDALVLRTLPFGESDLVVHLLTRRGRLTAIAKGARRSTRRFPGVLDLFNRVRAQVERPRRAGMARIEHARLVEPFLGLRTDARRYALACLLLELLDRQAPESGARSDLDRVFVFATEALAALARSKPDRRTRAWLELRALAALGLRPELRCCVRCGSEALAARVAFHVPEGGPLCPACAEGEGGSLEVHLGTLRALERGASLPLDRLERLGLSREAEREALRLLDRFQRFHVGVELRSAAAVERALAAVPDPASGVSPGARSHAR